jgi:hypothetical protein
VRVALNRRSFFVLGTSAAAFAAATVLSPDADACCPAAPEGKPVVNADQTVLIVWDAATKTQHFIRQASFRGMSNDFGFLIPTPTEPALDESGDAAFPLLAKITAPKVVPKPIFQGCGGGCSRSKGVEEESAIAQAPVRVLSEKAVAGFNATVLEASSAGALVTWLKERGFAFSPEVEAWAKPYVDGGWKITALRVAKKDGASGPIEATALRMSFKTDQPLFPYREPAPPSELGTLRSRLLRIYFLSDGRYQGTLTPDAPWTGRTAWSGEIEGDTLRPVVDALGISLESSTKWWLTEFEDRWPYEIAPADLYFSKADAQVKLERDPVYGSVGVGQSAVGYALAAAALLPIARRMVRKKSP